MMCTVCILDTLLEVLRNAFLQIFSIIMRKVRVPPGARLAAMAKADGETAGASLK